MALHHGFEFGALQEARAGIARRHRLTRRDRPQAQVAQACVLRQSAGAEHHGAGIGLRRSEGDRDRQQLLTLGEVGERPAHQRLVVGREQLVDGAPGPLLRDQPRQALDRADRAADPALRVDLDQQVAAGEGEGDEAIPVRAEALIRRAPRVARNRLENHVAVPAPTSCSQQASPRRSDAESLAERISDGCRLAASCCR
jgi:hypothetical protein